MSAGLWVLIGCLFLCVCLSAFFSASETAFSAASHVKLKTMGEEDKRALAALKLAESYDSLITTILIGNNLVNIAGTSIATVLFTMWVGGYGASLSTVVMTVLILIFGEVSPKTLAKETPERIAIAFTPVLNVMVVLLMPVNILFSLWKKLLTKVYHPAATENMIEAEIMTMVEEAQTDGNIDEHEGELIRSAIAFPDRDLTSVMTPRVDVTALPDDATMEEAAAVFRESGYSRVPVYHEDMDHVIGILNDKDFYSAEYRGCTDICEIIAAPVLAPQTLKISKLLKLFQSSKTHIVIVMDEFGGTEGIVTMEDVLEELVGEIYDEHDDVSQEMTRNDDGSFDVEGGMQLADMLEHFDVEDRWEADTVGGWAAEILGRIPSNGAEFCCEELKGKVIAMDKRRVTMVRISRNEMTESAGERRNSAEA